MVDTALFSRTVEAFYDSVLDQARWPLALERATEFVGGISAMLFHQDFRSAMGGAVHTWNVDPEWTKLYFEKYILMNPILPSTAFMDVGLTTSGSRVLDYEEFRRTVFYQEWAKPQFFGDVIVSILEKSATTMGLIGISQDDRVGVAQPDQIERLSLIAPHARRAVQLSHAFAWQALRAETLASGFDTLPTAILFLDGAARVLFANSAALAVDDDGFRVAGAQLSIAEPEAMKRLREVARAAENGEITSAAITMQIGDDVRAPRRILQFAPLTRVATAHRAVAQAVGVLLVRPLLPRSAPPLDGLAEAYRLTPRELQVFTGILQFGSVPEVARIFGLSPTTVRTHLQNIFDKTGVRSQAELIKLTTPLADLPGG
jgi:DNA-binding CsgD family transcriptional regulator